MDEIIIGYGSLMSADGLRDSDKAKDLSDAFKGYLVVNFPKGKRGFWKWSRNRQCFTLDISEFTLCCEEVRPGPSRPKEGFQCVALVIDAQDSKKMNHLEKIRRREGYPERAWNKIIEEATHGNTSVAKYLWNKYSFASLGECEWEKVHSKLQEYRQCLARLDKGTSLNRRYIPVPIKISEDKFGIISYAGTPPRGIANALKGIKKDNFVQYIGQCLLAKCHGVDVSDVRAQLEEMPDPDLRQKVQRYIRCKAPEEAQFPPLLGNGADPPLEK